MRREDTVFDSASGRPPHQPLVLVCGHIEYCGELISRRASCLNACGYRNKKEKLGSAQVVKEDGLKG
jgi:hypothetical protein